MGTAAQTLLVLPEAPLECPAHTQEREPSSSSQAGSECVHLYRTVSVPLSLHQTLIPRRSHWAPSSLQPLGREQVAPRVPQRGSLGQVAETTFPDEARLRRHQLPCSEGRSDKEPDLNSCNVAVCNIEYLRHLLRVSHYKWMERIQECFIRRGEGGAEWGQHISKQDLNQNISYTCNILQITSSRNSPRKDVSLHAGVKKKEKIKKNLKPRRQGLIISGGGWVKK